MKLKIENNIVLTDKEVQLVLMHSILNILGILIANIKGLGSRSRDPEIMKPAISTLSEIHNRLDDAAFTSEQLMKFDELHEYLSKSMMVIYDSYPELKNDDHYVSEVDNIFTILAEMRRRSEEIAEWQGDPFRVVSMPVSKFKSDIEAFFEAVASNSKGAYKVNFQNKGRKPKTYRMNLVVNADHDTLQLPAVFKDVIRDLLANARKYSLPGSKIDARLEQVNGITSFVCKDEGVGIPSAEIQKVTSLHYRASSGKARDTTGKGIGLTKAHYVVQTLKGQMWITSELSEGTTIEIKF